MVVDSWIPLATGGRVCLDPIDVSQVKIRDIALGLARQSRFNGQYQQIYGFYSVAEHCTLGSYVAQGGARLAFHVHDATEALIGDVIKPLKVMLPDYLRLENELEEALMARFHWPDWRTREVKLVDQQMVLAERNAMVHRGCGRLSHIADVTPANVTFNYWLPSMAAVVWEDRYNELKARGY
jgi:hypothetical protein